MDTCFLFVEHLKDTGCVLLKLSENAALSNPPKFLGFEEIKSLQKECKTYVVESCENASILSLELTWLPERKARLAIPFALEEKLAEPIENLHFAFDKQRYQDNHYLVTVIGMERMQHLMQLLATHGIEYDLITLDWFALAPQEFVVCGNRLLIHHGDFKGGLSGDLAVNYLKNHPLNQVFLFEDSELKKEEACLDEHSFVWIAKRLLKINPLNLCQGVLQRGNQTELIKKRYYGIGLLFAIWLLSILIVNALSLYTLNNKTAIIDKEIAAIYYQFFPNASQVISPKFRIQQLLGGNLQNHDAHFWFLLNQFAKAITENPMTIDQLRYQNQSLTARLVSPDFASIERVKNKMQESKLKVKQIQASTQDQQVAATLEFQ